MKVGYICLWYLKFINKEEKWFRGEIGVEKLENVRVKIFFISIVYVFGFSFERKVMF